MTSLNKEALNVEALDALDSPGIPSSDIIGTFNSFIMNELVLDGGANIIASIDAFACVEITQTVGIGVASAAAISFNEDVELRVTFAGNVISFEEQVENIFAGNVLSVEQSVYSLAANTFFNRNGWTVTLTIDGYIIPDDRIFKDITIHKEENQPTQCMFSLLMESPVEFIDAMWGKSITVDYTTSAGVQRMFTGVVAIPEIDIINKNVKFTCTNDRDNVINNTLAAFVKTVGRYSEPVLGALTTTTGSFGGALLTTPAEELNLRMQTIPYSFDFTSRNVGSLNSWMAKTIPDYTLTDSDVYYRQPKVIWQDRTKIKNKFTISLSYQYTRLYHYQRPFSWTFPYDFCTFVNLKASFPNIKMIEDAITNAKWLPAAPIVFTSLFPPSECVSVNTGFEVWNPTVRPGLHAETFDSLGNLISDPDGNNIFNFTPFNSTDDTSKVLCMGANWVGGTRFSQYIQEDYTLNVYSTQSRNQFGDIVDTSSVTVNDSFDSSVWDSYTTLSPVPSGAVSFGGGSYYVNEKTNPVGAEQAILTAIDRAKTSLLSTHRNTQVVIETPIIPDLELSHTVAVSTAKLVAKGKAQIISHTLSVSEGKGSKTELTIALFRSKGTATDTATYVPAAPADGIVLDENTVTLGSHYGVTDPSFNGHIGNWSNPATTLRGARTSVQEEFRVDTPAIPTAYRQLRTLATAANFEVFIPNDDLEITL